MREDRTVKPDIHPQYVVTNVTCSCGNQFTTRSTAKNGQIHVETCNVCHPFYTGKQRVLDTAGRVAKFQQKYAKVQAKKAKYLLVRRPRPVFHRTRAPSAFSSVSARPLASRPRPGRRAPSKEHPQHEQRASGRPS